MSSVLKDLAEFEGSTYISIHIHKHTQHRHRYTHTHTHPSRTLSIRQKV